MKHTPVECFDYGCGHPQNNCSECRSAGWHAKIMKPDSAHLDYYITYILCEPCDGTGSKDSISHHRVRKPNDKDAKHDLTKCHLYGCVSEECKECNAHGYLIHTRCVGYQFHNVTYLECEYCKGTGSQNTLIHDPMNKPDDCVFLDDHGGY